MPINLDDRKGKAPKLCPFPRGVQTRLIDVGLLHYEASLAGFAERYRRGESPHTVHVWWARRPHTAMRALTYACLTNNCSEQGLSMMQRFSSAFVPPAESLQAVRQDLVAQYPTRPRVLDMFGGGGTIGFEGALLGAEMYSLDSNELSVFTQKTILEFAPDEKTCHLSDLVREAGTRVLSRLKTETAVLFPLREQVLSYLWTYSLACKKCGYRFFLCKRPWVSRKSGKRVALVFEPSRSGQHASLQDVDDSTFCHNSAWIGRKGLAECPACSHLHASVSIRDTSDVLVVLVKHGQRRGKAFTADIRGAWPGDAEVAAFQERLLNELEVQLPDSRLPKWSGIVNPALYGIETHAEFVNRRQRAVLLALIKQLQIEFKHLEQRLPKNAAKAVVCLLSGLIDQLVDWNCRLSMWISQNEQVGRAFSGPGIPMLWDYVETDPVSTGPSNLWAKLDRIVSGSKAVEQLTQKCNVRHGYAQQLPYQDEFFDAIVTDPPYYDNVYYSVLSDFFFSWKRILFEKVEPSLFSQTTTDSTRELVASKFRSGDSDQAHSDYCYQLGLAILEAERVLKKDGVFSLLYSHSSLRGWDALVQAYRQTRLRITSVQPLSIERKARPRAMTSDAVNTCVVFVAHRANTEKKRATVSTLCKNLKTFTDTLVDGLENAGWRADDIGVAAFSQGVAMLANISGVSDYGSDMATLLEFEKVVQTRVPEFKVVNRRSL